MRFRRIQTSGAKSDGARSRCCAAFPRPIPFTSVAVSFGGDAAALLHEAPVLAAIGAPADPTPEDIVRVLTSLSQSGRRAIVLSRRAHLHSAQAQAIATILQLYPDAVVVSLMEPFDLPLFVTARHLLATYGDDAPSIGGLADVLFGNSIPTGRLPVVRRRERPPCRAELVEGGRAT